MIKKFYDTNALLDYGQQIFENESGFCVCDTTLVELENIKTNRNKTDDIKAKARYVVRWLDKNADKWEFISYNQAKVKEALEKYGLEDTPDNRICISAYFLNEGVEIKLTSWYEKNCTSNDDGILFCTDDILCRLIAENVFGLNVKKVSDDYSVNDDTDEDYTGYKDVLLTEQEMADLYTDLTVNRFNLLTNQYLIVYDLEGNLVDRLRWTGSEYQNIKIGNIKSNTFGVIKAYNGDVYQQCAINSLTTNQITMLTGKAGSGKTHLALGVMLSMLEKHKIDKIIVFCNPVATINSARLGFYPGSKNDKLLDSQVGNILGSKFGGSIMLEQMIQQEKIILLPMSDIRGYDTTNMNAAIYIMEAENMDVTLMKLALQRIGEDCICIIDGDYRQQVDMQQYVGDNNGMRRLSQVFRGQPFYGEVMLKNIYRSRIAEIADKM